METKRYTANYINADSNFEISNIPDTGKRDKFYSLYCILFNLLQRGCPTKPSVYLAQYIPFKSERKIHFFSKEVPKWGNIIKGNDRTNQFPARTFYYDILPNKFPEYPFLQQILIPEMPISEIIFDENEEFINQKVDFFLSESKLIIEIDGSQHAKKEQKVLDKARDEYIRNHGFEVIRIPTDCICDEYRMEPYIEKIRHNLEDNISLFSEYKKDYELCCSGQLSEKKMRAVAMIRFQILILQLCINGKLSIADKEWKIAINNKEVTGYESAAVEDIFLWLENLSKLAGITYTKPMLDIQQTTQLNSFSEEYIKLEFSVLSHRTTTSTVVNDRIYISNCWRQDVDYFQMTTAKPIKYVLDDTNDEQDTLSGAVLNEKRVALRFILKNIYGFDDFRPGQERIVINALKRRDTIGVLPTGSGKSLCYQLAVLLQPCISYCICPIKSLMIDQNQNLKNIGVSHTAYISSDLTPEERAFTQKNFAQNRYWLVFMSPERFQSETFREYLLEMSDKKKVNFGYAVIDEVHCLSEWGHSFRVSYLNLVKTIRKYCPNIALLGLTATASFNVLKNILIEFKMTDKKDVISIPSFTRPELKFKVVKCREDKYSMLKKEIDRYRRFYPDLLEAKQDKTRCGIIFTPYVNGNYGCYPLAIKLTNDYDADIRCYGGDMPKKWLEDRKAWDIHKQNVQSDFKNNRFVLLCATKAFGMGIDKPNIRYTIHYGIPSSLESLYQEAGRAGRDKNAAECVVLYTPENELLVQIKHYLSFEAKPSEIREFLEQKGNRNYGEDVWRQLFLLYNELSDVEEEMKILEALVQIYAEPGAVCYIKSEDPYLMSRADLQNSYLVSLANLQKYIYHLSLVGVVEDWTVDWKSNTLKVYFAEYTSESVLVKTQDYIRNYDIEYRLTADPLYEDRKEWNEIDAITQAAQIFLTWYNDNILYARRQALLNTMDACDAYKEEAPDEFKEKMEAYFRLDDISDMLGVIADQPYEVREWFEILNIDCIKKNKISNILMNLNRFLESYQNNAGLNYVSGILNLIDNHFDSPNGRTRLLASFSAIKDFKSKDKKYVLEQSAKLIAQLSEEPDAILKEEFSEFYVRNYPYDETDKVIYKEIQDNYSLKIFINRMMAYMVKTLRGGK